MATPKASFQVKIVDLNAVLAELSAAGLEAVAGPVAEQWVEESSKAFHAAVRAAAPVGTGRLSGWQRRSNKGHGAFRRSVRRNLRRAGLSTTARVRVGPIGNILRSGAKPHLEQAKRGHRLFVPGLVGKAFPTLIHHPGISPNPFWDRALADVQGEVEPLTRKAGFGTLERMATNIEKRSRRR